MNLRLPIVWTIWKKELSETFVEASREAAFSALAIPSELRRFLAQATRGDLAVQVGGLDTGVLALYTVFQQLLWGALGSVAATLAVVFDGRGQETARLLAVLAACLFALLLVGSLLRGRRFARGRR